ncbi:MAG: hypothetical protein CL831_01370 [Crocinitomicaceae bacterium]|nr:hypothetical protein [Crocinitomicaceae bacterium]
MYTSMIKRIFPAFILLFGLSFAPGGFAWSQAAPPTDIHLSELQSWLQTNWFDGYHNSLGYNEARRQMYGYIDNDGGQIECVYTGFTQSGGYVTYPNPINAEHLVPQSFFGSSEPMKSDIHILKPCHGSANSARGNKPYNEVSDGQAQWYGTVNNTYTSQGSAPSNQEVWSESSGGDWEPREDRKGDVARAAFYFYTMYPGAAGSITDMGPMATLHQWHLNDPADANEISRNDKIESQQGNRNPYIDYPELVYNAWLWEAGTSDTQGPDFSGTPSLVSVACDDLNAFNEITASPSDPCSPVTLSFTDVDTGLGCTGGNVTRTYSATDGCGNISTFTQTIAFTDSTPPIFTAVPSDITTTCDSELTDLGSAAASDNCTQVNITVDVVLVGGPCPEAYEVHRTFTAQDDCGNAAFYTQVINIEASVVVGCPEDVDNDGSVTVSDLLAVLSEFGCASGCLYDLNMDGIVGVADVLEILAAFGDAC